MTLLTRPKKTVATVVVATDGSGDTTDIQTGINLLPATGGVVYLKEGTYEPTQQITIPNSGIALIGAGASTIIRPTAALGTDNLFEATNQDNLLFQTLLVDRVNAFAIASAIYLNGCDECKIVDCWFDNVNDYAIHLNNCDYCIVRANICTDTDAYLLYDCNYCSIIDNLFTLAAQNLGVAGDSDKNILKGNIVNGTTIEIEDATCNSNILTDNIVANPISDVGTNTLQKHNIGGTYYLSLFAADFMVGTETDQYTINANSLTADAGIPQILASLRLPHGAVVIGCIVFGNAAAEGEVWTLNRNTLATSASASMATANINTEDTSITNPIIDNSIYSYLLQITLLDTADKIYGARITYTF